MTTDVLILGAGVTGLTAGRHLQENGLSVQILDKGRGVGGRVATRWKGTREHIEGRWDHGAQFATFRSDSLISNLQKWGAWELMEEWIPSHSDPSLKRRVPSEGMNAFAKALAQGLTVHTSQRASRLIPQSDSWKVETTTGKTFEAKHLLSTIPIPQFLDLLIASDIQLENGERAMLHQVQYDLCLSLLAETESPAELESDGYARVKSGVLELVINNVQKGISASPTLTAHATPSFSLEWYDRDRETAASVLRAALQELLEESIVSVQIHGWKFSKPSHRIPQPFLTLANGCTVAGDAFEAGDDTVDAGLHPRIESAMLSGLQAAHNLVTNGG